MIPISDELPTRRVPVVTWLLIAANVEFYIAWGAVPAYITNPLEYPLAPVTLLTSMFIHAGWSHLIGNLIYLWIFGDNVEDVLGPVWYGLFYIAAGIVAGLAQVIVAPSSTVPGIGASGAVAGALAVYLVLFPRAPVRVLVPGLYFVRLARLPALIVLGFWFVLQLFNGFLSLGAMGVATGGVAWFAHIGGFVAGLAVGLLARVLRPRRPLYY
jgi:membrane associated rhomboid family serine protease